MNVYRISHDVRWYMIFIQLVVYILSPSLRKGIQSTQRVEKKIKYHHKSLEILYISHVLPRILLNPNRLCKTDICEPHSTFTIRRQNLTHGKSSLKFSKQTFNFRAYFNQFMQKQNNEIKQRQMLHTYASTLFNLIIF